MKRLIPIIIICLFSVQCERGWLIKIINPETEEHNVLGCMRTSACNYNFEATEDDGSCSDVKDCAGLCGGAASIDVCGVCGGNGDCSCPNGMIKDCMGVCGGITEYDECGVCGGDGIEVGKCDCDGSVKDCDSVCGGTAVEDACGLCGGDGSSCGGIWAIYYNVSTPIGGFEFDVEGVTVTGASGGEAATAGFTISTANNKVLGFSISGATIPVGDRLLVVLNIDGNKTDACLSNVVLSDDSGVSIAIEQSPCITIIKEE